MPDSPSRTPSPRRDRIPSPSLSIKESDAARQASFVLNIVDVDDRRSSSLKTVNKSPDPPPFIFPSPTRARSAKNDDPTRRADARPGFQGNRDQIPDDMEKSRSERLHAIQDLKKGHSKNATYQQYLNVNNLVPRKRSLSRNRSPSPRRAKSGNPSLRSSTSARSGKSGKSTNLSVSNYGQGPGVSGSINRLNRSPGRPAKSAISNYSQIPTTAVSDYDQMFCEVGCTCIECSDVGDLTRGYHCDTDSELSTEYVTAVYNTTSPSSFAAYMDGQEENDNVTHCFKRQDQTRVDDLLSCYDEGRHKYAKCIRRYTIHRPKALVSEEHLDDKLERAQVLEKEIRDNHERINKVIGEKAKKIVQDSLVDLFEKSPHLRELSGTNQNSRFLKKQKDMEQKKVQQETVEMAYDIVNSIMISSLEQLFLTAIDSGDHVPQPIMVTDSQTGPRWPQRTPSGMVIVSPPVMVDSEHCTATIHSTQPGMVIAAALGKINVQKAGEKTHVSGSFGQDKVVVAVVEQHEGIKRKSTIRTLSKAEHDLKSLREGKLFSLTINIPNMGIANSSVRPVYLSTLRKENLKEAEEERTDSSSTLVDKVSSELTRYDILPMIDPVPPAKPKPKLRRKTFPPITEKEANIKVINKSIHSEASPSRVQQWSHTGIGNKTTLQCDNHNYSLLSLNGSQQQSFVHCSKAVDSSAYKNLNSPLPRSSDSSPRSPFRNRQSSFPNSPISSTDTLSSIRESADGPIVKRQINTLRRSPQNSVVSQAVAMNKVKQSSFELFLNKHSSSTCHQKASPSERISLRRWSKQSTYVQEFQPGKRDSRLAKVPFGELLFLFDVDSMRDTLKQQVNYDVLRRTVDLCRLRGLVGVVTACSSCVNKQILSLDLDYIVTSCGQHVYRKGSGSDSKKTIRQHEGEKLMQRLVNFVLYYIGWLKLPCRRGRFVDVLDSHILICPVGNGGSYRDYDQFKHLDNRAGIRESFIKALNNQFKETDLLFTLSGDLEIRGAPLGWDYGLSQTTIGVEPFSDVIIFSPRNLPKLESMMHKGTVIRDINVRHVITESSASLQKAVQVVLSVL